MSGSPASPLAGLATGIDHITLPVADLAVAERFYCGLLGATMTRRLDEEAFRRLRPERVGELGHPHNSPLHLSLGFGGEGPQLDLFLQGTEPLAPRPDPHLALGVAGAHLDAVKRTLTDAGVSTDGPRRLGPPGQASLYSWIRSATCSSSSRAITRGPCSRGPRT